MVYNQGTNTPAPDDWRAYSGVLSRRFFAFLIDYLFIFLLCIPALVIITLFGIITLGFGFLLYPITFFIVAVPYFGFTLSGTTQATPGMRMFGVQMMRLDGSRIDLLVAVAHVILFWVFNSVLTPLILLIGLFTNRSRLLHDFLLGTVFVRTN